MLRDAAIAALLHFAEETVRLLSVNFVLLLASCALFACAELACPGGREIRNNACLCPIGTEWRDELCVPKRDAGTDADAGVDAGDTTDMPTAVRLDDAGTRQSQPSPSGSFTTPMDAGSGSGAVPVIGGGAAVPASGSSVELVPVSGGGGVAPDAGSGGLGTVVMSVSDAGARSVVTVEGRHPVTMTAEGAGCPDGTWSASIKTWPNSEPWYVSITVAFDSLRWSVGALTEVGCRLMFNFGETGVEYRQDEGVFSLWSLSPQDVTCVANSWWGESGNSIPFTNTVNADQRVFIDTRNTTCEKETQELEVEVRCHPLNTPAVAPFRINQLHLRYIASRCSP